MAPRTFGFEAEFGTNIATLATAMHDAELIGMRDPHPWHCSCDNCHFGSDNPYPYRAQTDSSCGGEIISSVHDTSNWALARAHMLDLERLAWSLDVEPSLDAGFHVHVGIPATSTNWPDWQGRLPLVFAQWEDVLVELAGGRWPEMRSFNHSIVPAVARFEDYWRTYRQESRGDYTLQDVRNYFYDSDNLSRHSTINFSTNHGTIEFRLWNSTRVAWRMELWCRLSVLLTDPNFLIKLQRTPPTLQALLDIVQLYDDVAAQLMAVQLGFMGSSDIGHGGFTQFTADTPDLGLEEQMQRPIDAAASVPPVT